MEAKTTLGASDFRAGFITVSMRGSWEENRANCSVRGVEKGVDPYSYRVGSLSPQRSKGRQRVQGKKNHTKKKKKKKKTII